MKGTKKLKQVLVTGSLLLGMLSIIGTTSQAALQSNPTTHNSAKAETGANWITMIRQMEESGQTMGLNEKVDTATCLSSSGSNNIDVHMMKSTEYGAMAILSVSGFGNPNKLQDSTIKSTTGNVTGVYINTSAEWTASIGGASTIGKDARYYDLYISNNQTSAKVGDALGLSSYQNNPGCSGWHGGSARWIDDSQRGFTRGGSRMFSFDGEKNNMYTNTWQNHDALGRGVAVVKEGI